MSSKQLHLHWLYSILTIASLAKLSDSQLTHDSCCLEAGSTKENIIVNQNSKNVFFDVTNSTSKVHDFTISCKFSVAHTTNHSVQLLTSDAKDSRSNETAYYFSYDNSTHLYQVTASIADFSAISFVPRPTFIRICNTSCNDSDTLMAFYLTMWREQGVNTMDDTNSTDDSIFFMMDATRPTVILEKEENSLVLPCFENQDILFLVEKRPINSGEFTYKLFLTLFMV